MGSTQYYVAQSLDGFIADSEGGVDWLTGYRGQEADVSEVPEGGYDSFFAQVGALAMGSATYEFILGEGSGRWPSADVPTWVFTSRELPAHEDADLRFVKGPVRRPHEEMRAAAGERNVWIVGGGDLALQFASADLLDEIILTVVPVVLGAGIPALPSPLPGDLRLTGTEPRGNGMVELRYSVVR